MDKVEYRELIREIKNKYLQNDYEGVIAESEQLDIERIRENSILEIIAKAYENLSRWDLAKEVLMVAYKRMPAGKRIAYNLSVLCIKLDELDDAVKYYEDFCKMAPKDNQRLLLKYQIGKAGGVSVANLAHVLEKYTSREMDEKWQYELARLYHELGDDEKCAAACDQIILWYANGEYEKKALELKNMHKALTPSQQARYEEIMQSVLEDVTTVKEEYPENKDEEKAEDISETETVTVPEAEETEETEDTDSEKSQSEENADGEEAEEERAEEKQPEEEKTEQEPEEKLPEIDYDTKHLGSQDEQADAAEEDIAGQMSLTSMFESFKKQSPEETEKMNRIGADRAAKILAEVNSTHDSSKLDQFKDENHDDEASETQGKEAEFADESFEEVVEPEVPLLNREDQINPVDDGGEDLWERKPEFAFEMERSEKENKAEAAYEEEDIPEPVIVEKHRGKSPEKELDLIGSPAQNIEQSIDATQYIPVDEIARLAAIDAEDDEETGSAAKSQPDVSDFIDPSDTAGRDSIPSKNYEKGRELTEAEKAIIAYETSKLLNEGSDENAGTLNMNELLESGKDADISLDDLTDDENSMLESETGSAEDFVQDMDDEETSGKKSDKPKISVNSLFGFFRKDKKKKNAEDADEADETAEDMPEDSEEEYEENEGYEESAEETAEAEDEVKHESLRDKLRRARAAKHEESSVKEEAAEVPEDSEEEYEDTEDSEEPEAENNKKAASGIGSLFSLFGHKKKKAVEEAEEIEGEIAAEKDETEDHTESGNEAVNVPETETRKESDNVSEVAEKAGKIAEAAALSAAAAQFVAETEKSAEKAADTVAAETVEKMVSAEITEEAAETVPAETVGEEVTESAETAETKPAEAVGKAAEEAPAAAEVIEEAAKAVLLENVKEAAEPVSTDADTANDAEAETGDDSGEIAEPSEKEIKRAEKLAKKQEKALKKKQAKDLEKKIKKDLAEQKSIEKRQEKEAAKQRVKEERKELKENPVVKQRPERRRKEVEANERKYEKEKLRLAASRPVIDPDVSDAVDSAVFDGKTAVKAAAAAAAVHTAAKAFSIEDFVNPGKPLASENDGKPEIDVNAFIKTGEQAVPENSKKTKSHPGDFFRREKTEIDVNAFVKEEKPAASADEKKPEVDVNAFVKENKPAASADEKKQAVDVNTFIKPDKTVVPEFISKKAEKQEINPENFIKAEPDADSNKAAQAKKTGLKKAGRIPDVSAFIKPSDDRKNQKNKDGQRKISFEAFFAERKKNQQNIENMVTPAAVPVPIKKTVYNKKYELSKQQRKDLAEFLLIDGMEAEICSTIEKLVIKKKSGDETGGHLIITGDKKTGKTYLVIEIIKAVNEEVGHGNARVAKVQAQALNGKNIKKVLSKVTDSDLIIENIGKLEDDTIKDLINAVRESNASTMVILEGNELAADTMIQNFPDIGKIFKTRIDIGELTLTQWADLAKKYAAGQGYSISDMAELSLHAKIDEINTPDVRLGFKQVREVVDDAIEKAEKRSSGKLFSAFTKKNDALIPLEENDFM